MRCPQCNVNDDRVADSREIDDGRAVRRQRRCRVCQHVWDTVEGPGYRPAVWNTGERVRRQVMAMEAPGRKLVLQVVSALAAHQGVLLQVDEHGRWDESSLSPEARAKIGKALAATDEALADIEKTKKEG